MSSTALFTGTGVVTLDWAGGCARGVSTKCSSQNDHTATKNTGPVRSICHCPVVTPCRTNRHVIYSIVDSIPPVTGQMATLHYCTYCSNDTCNITENFCIAIFHGNASHKFSRKSPAQRTVQYHTQVVHPRIATYRKAEKHVVGRCVVCRYRDKHRPCC